MSQSFLLATAFVGGVFLAAQGGFNAQLGVLLKNPLLAAGVAYLVSTFVAAGFIFLSVKSFPNTATLKEIPTYLWFSGGVLSLIGITLYYFTIPRLGISTMITLGLSGQIIFSMIAAHFGLFNLPKDPITLKKIIGVVTMISGILLINYKR